jgi:transposase
MFDCCKPFKVMKKLIHFIGIDVSKLTIDVAIIINNDIGKIIQLVFANGSKGFKELKSFLGKEKISFQDTVFCIEHTGYYSKQLSRFVITQQGNLWMEMSLKIIRSLGVQRGKNDKLDAKRIALFAQRNQQDFVPYNPPRLIVENLKTLLMLREKLINSKTALVVPINELTSVDKAAGKLALKAISKALLAIKNNIATLDTQIDELIKSDKELTEKFTLVTSVPGIARVTFCYLIYFTNEFKNYSEGKQLACYCGVVPFEYTSGSSVRGKPRVHNMANKKMKKLLHTAALCAVTYYPEFKNYYERKIEEGKPKMLILNNVRNKIILRIAAVIKNNKPYQIAA